MSGRRAAGFRVAACALAGMSLAAAAPSIAFAEENELQDLSRLSLEELGEVEVTSVSRRPEPLGQAASAVFVISAEDIRRSGATSLPEVLRMAPNLQVQRVNSSDYAISARGFNGFETANKLLVLVDGRSLYEPLHAGIFWDVRTMLLHDIERIEVISGPGGALYGANAVNGVINIITRSAKDTKGLYAEAVAGDEDQLLGIRQGGSLGESGAWRAYALALRRDDSMTAAGGPSDDETDGLRAGFRADLAAGSAALTIQGDAFQHNVPLGYNVEGGNILGRWARPLQGGGALQVQGYYDRTERTLGLESEVESTVDLHFQHNLAARGRHQVIWGGGYRTINSVFEPVPGSGSFLLPGERDIGLVNLFIQDQLALRDNLTLTLGFKYEDSSLSGDEYMPSARLAWRTSGDALVWGSVSSASRTATRIESDLTSPGVLVGGNFQSEHVVAYELGYRRGLGSRANISVSVFYNDYSDLRTADFADGIGLPLQLANGGEGQTFGAEAWGNLDINDRWRISAGVSTLEKSFKVEPGEMDLTRLVSTGDDPGYQLLLRSSADLTDRLELDIRVRAVDELDVSGLEGYVDADIHLGWRVTDGVELALSAANLFDNHRYETTYSRRDRAIGRSVQASLRLGF